MRMKKKIVIALLTTTMIATIFSGCGASETANNNVAEAAEMSQESESSETIENTVESDTELTATPDATTEPTEANIESSEASNVADTTETETSQTQLPQETPKPTEEPQATEPPQETPIAEEKEQYTYTDMDKTMWAKSSVNVRDLPSTDGSKVGSLKASEEVKVTGQCNETGWYRLEGNRYVSNNYLVDSKPVQQASQPNQPAQPTTPTTPTQPTQPSTPTETPTQEAQLLSGFLDILNVKRAEEGLSQVSGSSSLDAIALAGAKELETNYSHQVGGGGYDRVNIGKGFGLPGAQVAFDAWYNSEGHRKEMMDPYLTEISAAYYNGYIIFIGNIDEDTYYRDMAQQSDTQAASGELQHDNSVDVGNGQTIDVSSTPGSDTPDDKYTDEEKAAQEDAFRDLAESLGF